MDIPDIFTWKIIKWVVIVLVAGFIGQFGKSFAQQVIGWFRRRRTDHRETLRPSEDEQSPYPSKPVGERQYQEERLAESQVNDAALKLRKKETKALLKAKKKEAKGKSG